MHEEGVLRVKVVGGGGANCPVHSVTPLQINVNDEDTQHGHNKQGVPQSLPLAASWSSTELGLSFRLFHTTGYITAGEFCHKLC